MIFHCDVVVFTTICVFFLGSSPSGEKKCRTYLHCQDCRVHAGLCGFCDADLLKSHFREEYYIHICISIYIYIYIRIH